MAADSVIYSHTVKAFVTNPSQVSGLYNVIKIS